MTRAGREPDPYAIDLDTLLAIANNGWAVHPLIPGKKAPATKHGFRDATTDPEQIRSWWEEEPGLGWGTPTATVADIDRAEQMELELPLEDNWQDTPSGGRHILLKADPTRRLPGKLPGDAGEWRPDGKAYVKIYDPKLFAEWDPDYLPPIPEEAFTATSRSVDAHLGESEPLELTTREELIALVGRLRSDGLEESDIRSLLRTMRDDGRIYDSDPSDPWTDKDLDFIAKEAGKWKRGEVVGAPRIKVRGHEDSDDPVRFMEFSWLRDVDEEDPKPLLLDRLHPDELTILFGDGGTGKGVIAAWWAARMAMGGMRILVIDYEQHTRYEWRPRVRRFAEPDHIEEVLSRVAVVQPDRPIWQAAPAIRAFCEQEDIDYVILDSILYAVGNEEAEKSQTAIKVTAAYQEIGLPMLALAHTTKADADPRHPFGSVFWSNSARITMSFVGQGDQPRTLSMKKTNQKMAFHPVEYDWSWTATEDQPPRTLEESEHAVSNIEAFCRVVGREWMSTAQAVDALTEAGFEVAETTLRAALSRELKRGERGGKSVHRPRVEKRVTADATQWRSANVADAPVTRKNAEDDA